MEDVWFMEEFYLFYDSGAKTNDGLNEADCLEVVLEKCAGKADMSRITNYRAFLSDKMEYPLVICGGVANLSRFVNAVRDMELPNPIYYFTFEENDFWRELGVSGHDQPICITKELSDLPTCEINEDRYVLLSGVSCGLDSRFFEWYEKEEESGGKRKHLWFQMCRELWNQYKPVDGLITVDDVSKTYQKVWMSSVVYGDYYGGAKLPDAYEKGSAGDRHLSVMILHGCDRWNAFWTIWNLFCKNRVMPSKHLEILTGKEITVVPENPLTGQLDGQTQKHIKRYRVVL